MAAPSPVPSSATVLAKHGQPITFQNFTELPSYLPPWAWRLLRLLSVMCALGLSALLWLHPAQGLPVFWGLVVPVLPLVFMMTPGLWRNMCPLATSNQVPRRLGIARGLAQKSLSQGTAYPIGITLMIGAVIARRLWFNGSGRATAGLIVGAMLAAFIGGLLFKGKSGWCSSICPLLPVQRLYGQTPFIKIANTQCDTCVGCAKNCYDFNPGVAYLADQYDPNPNYRNFRRFFASIFPGLILGYYLVPEVSLIGPFLVVAQMLLFMAGSLAVFTLLDLLVGSTRNALPVLSAALAINLYYWFAAPLMSQVLTQLGVHPDLTLIGALRAAVAIGSLVWVARSLQTEHLFLRDQVRRSSKGEIRLAPVVVETLHFNHEVVAVAVAELVAQTEQEALDRAADDVLEGFAPTAPAALDTLERHTAPDAHNASLMEASTAAVATPSTHRAPLAARSAQPRSLLRLAPDGRELPLRTGQTLLDALEAGGAAIHPGCRAGACGADPVAITAGAECLARIGDTECATLARLGLAPNTRLACMARLHRAGAVTVELKPHPQAVMAPAPAGVPPSPTRVEAADSEAAQALVSQPAPFDDAAAAPAATERSDAATAASEGTRDPFAAGPAPAAASGSASPSPSPSLSLSGWRAIVAAPAGAPGARLDIRRVVVVGTGIAGLTAAETLRREHPQCTIDLIGNEPHLPYNRLALSSLLAGGADADRLTLRPAAWFEAQRIRLHTGVSATGLDCAAHVLTLDDGLYCHYDRLVIATGAQAWVPPIAGFGGPACHVLRQLADVQALTASLDGPGPQRAIVAGAGLLGLEAAAALRQRGVQVDVLSLHDRVLDRQVDASASRLVCAQLARLGIGVRTQAALRAVETHADGRLRAVCLDDGRRLDADLLLLCVGSRPDLGLARAGGLRVGRGITVDARLQTSAPDVFAAGDVAECAGEAPGLWAVATEQGRVAALAALGLAARYQVHPPVTALKLPGLAVRSAGRPEPAGPNQRSLVLPAWDEACGPAAPAGLEPDAAAAHHTPMCHAKLVLEGDRVMGAVVVGDDPRGELLLDAVSQRSRLAKVRTDLARLGAEDAEPLPDAVDRDAA